MAGIGRFLKNTWIELKRVHWPSRRELTSYTITVVITVAFLTVFFALLDYVISELLYLVTG